MFSRSGSSGTKRKPLRARQQSVEITATSANAFLKADKFEKSEQGGSSSCNFIYSAAAVQGFRSRMQDDFACKPNLDVNDKKYGYFGVFDGHGDEGEIVSQYCADNVIKLLLNRKAVRQAKQVSNDVLAAGVHKTFVKLDQELRLSQGQEGKPQFEYCGTTACVVLISQEDILFANVGDSRALLCRNGCVVFETKDHNPSDEDEEKRVKEGGGKVHMTPGRHKVILDPAGYSNLSVSRTIGDFAFKPPGKLPAQSLPVSPAPDINVVARERNGDEFLLIASDGVFKSLTSSQVVDFVLRQLQITDDLTKICRNLIDMAYFAHDNIPDDTTVILVVFPAAPSISQQIVTEEVLLDIEATQAIDDLIKEIVSKAEAHWVVNSEFNVLQRLVKELPEKYRVQQRVAYVLDTLSRCRADRFGNEEEEVFVSPTKEKDASETIIEEDEVQEDSEQKLKVLQNETSTSAFETGGNKDKENVTEIKTPKVTANESTDDHDTQVRGGNSASSVDNNTENSTNEVPMSELLDSASGTDPTPQDTSNRIALEDSSSSETKDSVTASTEKNVETTSKGIIGGRLT